MVAITRKDGHQPYPTGTEKAKSDGTQSAEQGRQTALLTGVAEAARQLLAIEDFATAVNGALEAVATSANIDRIYILENFTERETDRAAARMIYEWVASDTLEVLGSGGLTVYCDDFKEQVELNKRGKPYQVLARDLTGTARYIQDRYDALSLLTVPIMCDDGWWGVIGFDDCTAERVWSEAEIAVLETAAATFAAALQRRGSVVTLQSRDALLDSVNGAAQCLVANEDLAEAIPQALRILGEGTRQDRVYVFENVYPNGPNEVFWDAPYEWTTHGIPIGSDVAPDDFPIAMSSFPSEIIKPISTGKTIQFLRRDLDGNALSFNDKVQALSLIGVPIFVMGQWWGALGFDDCTTERVWSEAEIAVLETAAACIGSAIERDLTQKSRMAEVEAHNQQLSERDRILEATAAAANVMLTDDDFDSAVNGALQTVGEGLGVDRVSLWQYFDAPKPQENAYTQGLYEWTAEDVPVQIEHPELARISDEGVEFIIETLRAGHIFGGVVEELPEPFRSIQLEACVKSIYNVPFFVNNSFWGFISFDDCHKLTRRSEAELEALRTLANCIGSAIEQDLTQKARGAAERSAIIEQERAARADELEAANRVLSVRDRWLQTTATAANQLISGANVETGVQTALQTIGENLECDRVTVMRYLPDLANPPLGEMQMLYEWDAEGIRSQIKDPELNTISSDGFEEWFERIAQGECMGSSVSELPEPARSEMAALDILSTYAVPIFIDNNLWGIVGMDYCHEERQLGDPELAVFKTAATCVGSAIYQAQARRDKAAQERAKLLGSVAEAANLLLRSADYEQVLPEVVRLLGEVVECDRCGIMKEIIHPTLGKPALRVSKDWEWSSPQTLPTEMYTPREEPLFFWEDAPYCSNKLKNGEIVNSLVADLPEADQRLFEIQGNTSELFVPIFVGEKLWGLISFDNCGEPRLYDEAEIAILQIAAESIAGAIARQTQDEALRAAEKAIAQEREKAARERAEKLAKTNKAVRQTLDVLTTTPDLDQFLGTTLSQIIEQIQAACAHLFLYDELTHTLNSHLVVQGNEIYQNNAPDDPEILRYPVPADITPFWQVLTESSEPFTLDENNALGAELFWPTTVEWHESRGHQSSTCVCLKLNDKPIGFVGFAFTQYTVLSDEQIEFIQALTNQATLAIHLTHLAEDAKQAAILQEQEKAAQTRAEQLSRSNQALKSNLDLLAKQPDLEAFLQGVVNEATAQTGAETGHLFLLSADGHTLQLQFSTDNNGDWRSDPDMELWLQPVPTNEAPDFWAKIFEREAFVWEDMQSTLKPGPHIWKPSIAWHLRRGHTSAICAPLVLGDQVLGFFGLAFVGETEATQEALELAQALTNQATLAIQFTRLAEEARQAAILQEQEKAASERAAELAKTNQALGQTLEALTSEPELDRFLGQILTQIVEQIGADDTHLFLYDEAENTLRSHIAVQGDQTYLGHAPEDPELFHTPFPASITAAWQLTIDSPAPLILDENNPDLAEIAWPTTPEWHEARGHQSAVCLCLKVGDKAIGLIGFAFCKRTILTEEQLEFIQALTNQATLAIHLTQLAAQSKTAALNVAITEERNRLAREIHDTLAQAFTGISLQLEAGKSLFNVDAAETYYHIERAGEIARKGLAEARRSVKGLRSQVLTTSTLPEALRTTLDTMTQDSATKASFQLLGAPYALPENMQTNLLRIGQEATTNALRHAHADTLTLTLAYEPDRVRMRVVDDGQGAQIISLNDVKSFGLIGMRERVLRFSGEFHFTSSPGQGTQIDITIPTNLIA